MRLPRFKAPPGHPGPAYYHCLSRVIQRQFLFEPREKERFVALMREYERFCRVRVLTYCLLSNHFHILLEVPPKPEVMPSPEEIVADLRRLSGHQAPDDVAQRFQWFRDHNDPKGLADYLATFHARMYDVSAFMKLLKQRFTQWYNGCHARKGTLWEERFRSVLVDSAGHALATMAAYIDLNPVRAGLTKDPRNYRWCGYGEAMAGRRKAKLALQFVVKALQDGAQESLSRSLAVYRTYLYLEGDERRAGLDEQGRPRRASLSAEEVSKVLVAKGKLPLSDYLRCRVRYFCDGAVFGGRDFVEGIFKTYRKRFPPSRKTGARKLRGLASPALYAMRDLQVNVFGKPATGDAKVEGPKSKAQDRRNPERRTQRVPGS